MWFMGQDGPTCGCVGCGNAPLPLFASLLLESSSPHPTPPSRKGKRLKEILRISTFAYHTYTCREMQQPFSWRALPGQPWELCRWLHTHAALLRGRGPPSIPEFAYPMGWGVRGRICPEGEPLAPWQCSALAVACEACRMSPQPRPA